MIDWPGAINRWCPFCGAAPGVGCMSLAGDRPPQQHERASHQRRAFVPTPLGVRRDTKGKSPATTHVRHPWDHSRALCGYNLVALDVQGKPTDAKCRDCRTAVRWLDDHPDADPPAQPIHGDRVTRPRAIADIVAPRSSTPGGNSVEDGRPDTRHDTPEDTPCVSP